jgi:exodeoxyribonuclease-3
LEKENPDILCIQETKAEREQLPSDFVCPPGYNIYWNAAERKGYSGVAIFTRPVPKSVETEFEVERFNNEGRILIADYDSFVLFNFYFPNGQKDDERLQYKMDFNEQLLLELKRFQGRKILICGDYNTAHHPIDLTHPKANEKTSGFLPIERAWIDKLCALGYTDTFRHFYPDTVKYSWWSYRMAARSRNVGWRIDYHFVNEELLPHVQNAFILNEVMGSDHCPVGVELSI